ncbi:E7 [Hemidactylus frenatus papillomavirus]|uniref:E7 n=1 Tax=Hemidactylus frenatus papillomavirus TaxID=2588389 RepID=A0A5P1KK74_9PAPI|nr:E7 [Hemidactylus frenatus papillomavirus]
MGWIRLDTRVLLANEGPVPIDLYCHEMLPSDSEGEVGPSQPVDQPHRPWPTPTVATGRGGGLPTEEADEHYYGYRLFTCLHCGEILTPSEVLNSGWLDIWAMLGCCYICQVLGAYNWWEDE